MCVTCVKVVVVFSAATVKASTSGHKRLPADEGTPSTKRRDAEEGASEGTHYSID